MDFVTNTRAGAPGTSNYRPKTGPSQPHNPLMALDESELASGRWATRRIPPA
jgi:hypothetical protein